jgi:hypothetical protein
MGEAEQSPLEDLLRLVHGDETVPDASISAYAPHGSLDALWSTCDDVGVMVDLAALCVDAPILARAACACARRVVKYLPPARWDEAYAALVVAERWARGDASIDPDDLAVAATTVDHAYANAEPVVPVLACAAASVDAAVSSAATAAGYDTSWYDVREARTAAHHAALCAKEAIAAATKGRPDAASWIPDVLRAELPCPTLDGIRRGLAQMLAEDP